MLSKLCVRRLNTLADFMDALPPSAQEHFYMGNFFYHTGDHKHKFGKYITRRDLNLCGTTACAQGWAATIPAFRRQGLRMNARGVVRFNRGREDGDNFFAVEDCDRQAGAHKLFYRYHIRTLKGWARMCRKFIRENA